MFEIYSAFPYMIAFALSILTAYIDLDTYFKQKARFRNSFWKHGPTMSFFLFNGVLAASMMIAAKSNGWITKDVWALAFVSGLGTAGLLRSKVFTFGQDNVEVGFEFIYNYFKNQTISNLIYVSGIKKVKISFELAEKYLSVDRILEKVNNVAVELAKNANWDAGRTQTFNNEIQASKIDPPFPTLRDKLAASFRVFIDYSDLKYVTQLLEDFLK